MPRRQSEMGNIFPSWTNWIAIKVLICLGAIGTFIIAVAWYSFTPKQTRVGYMPEQPIPFDHSLHAGQLGMDCRYCHSFVENSSHSNLPAAEVCWNCHGPGKVKSDSPKLELLRQAMDKNDENYTGKPIEWVQVHETPDYAYFNHAAHVNRGVSCVECHGRVDQMPVVYHAKPLSMGFCLDCHRNPDGKIRPLDKVTDLGWEASEDEVKKYLTELAGDKKIEVEEGQAWTPELLGKHLREKWAVNPPQDCTACHR